MYSEVLPSIRGMASALTKMGFKKGDMMIMFTSNHVLYFITILSAWKCGVESHYQTSLHQQVGIKFPFFC